MKILITAHHLNRYEGSEIYTIELIKALKKKGHDISVYTPVLGEISKKLDSIGVKAVDNISEFSNEKFDIAHTQHNTTAILVRSIFPKLPIIFISHGVLPELEQPPSVDIGISKYIAVSEEVEKNLIRNHRIPKNKIEIVRNPVDTGKIRPYQPINDKLKNVLVLTNRYPSFIKDAVRSACNDLNINFFHVGLPENPQKEVEKWINKADVAITLGRGVIEALSCARNAIVFGVYGMDGFVDKDTFYELRKNNFSGRRFSYEASAENLKNELKKYRPDIGSELRQIVIKENSLNSIALKFEGVYERTLKEDLPKSVITQGQLLNEISFLEKSFKARIEEADEFNKIIRQKDKEFERKADGYQSEIKETMIHLQNMIKEEKEKNKQKELLIQKKDQEIKRKGMEIASTNRLVRQKDREIISMKSSKFWKMREKYMSLKDKLKAK